MKVLKNIPFKFVIYLSVFLLTTSCVEELELDSKNFESILVVEGIITDRKEIQEIRLSRSYELEENGPSPVINADVHVKTSSGEDYIFKETSDGIYHSQIDFSANPTIEYTLEIRTGSGTYESAKVLGQEKTLIDNIRSMKAVLKEETGVAILVSSSDENSGNYYKYEYEETYKIVSPYKKYRDLIINESGEFEVVPKTKEEYICYNTLASEDIVLSSTTNLLENNIDDYLVRFLSKENSKIAYRYSILVKQLKISAETHAFYTTLKNLSETENIFSQYQPGFLNGNIQETSGNGEKVLGFFSTAAVDEARLFFNYTDYFDEFEDPRPSHYGPCEPFVPERDVLRELVLAGAVEFFQEDPPEVYHVIAARCVDCNFFGTNVQPDFWIE